MNDNELLRWLSNRCQRNFASNEQAQSFLRQNGITNETVWRQYRIGVGDKSFLSDLDAADKERLKSLKLLTWNNRFNLAGSGISIPTYAPRQPEHPLGFVRVNASQGQHRFASPPAGIACPASIDRFPRIVITDAPLLCLRLAQSSIDGIVLAESPEVLPPLVDWLRTKTITVASYKKEGLKALKSALDALGIESSSVLVNYHLSHTNAEALHALGIDRQALLAQRPPPEPITPELVSSIVEFAQRRLAEGDGLELLNELNADDPELVNAYGLGYLPKGFRSALPREEARAIGIEGVGRSPRLGNTIVIPAVDRSGLAVDLQATCEDKRTLLVEEPAGLLGARIAMANDEIIIVDAFGSLVDQWRKGKRNVLLLRGPADARLNAGRLFDSGVRSAIVMARREGKQIAVALERAGIVVERKKYVRPGQEAKAEEKPAKPMPDPPATKPMPTFVSFDQRSRQATFKAGDATCCASYSIEVPLESSSRLLVRLEHNGKIATERFDLAVEPQRRRFSTSAAMKTGLSFEQIMNHLVHLLDEVLRIQADEAQPVQSQGKRTKLADADRRAAMEFLKRIDLLDAIGQDMESLGWPGEADAKRLLYLVAISRKLARPLSAVRQSSNDGGKGFGLRIIGELIPEEDILHVSRLTASSLHHQADLKNKVLLIDNANGLKSEAWVAIQVLQTRGVLSQSYAVRESVQSVAMPVFNEARGPVAVLTACDEAGQVPGLARCYLAPVDESPEQTARVLESQRRMCAKPESASSGLKARIVKRHHSIQRLLECMPVLIPFAERIRFPSNGARCRAEQEKFLTLIEASAVLHQFQRLRHKTKSGEQLIVADLRDYQIASTLAADSIARADDELGSNAREVLGLIVAAKLDRFTTEDLKPLRPSWTRHRFRAGLAELLKAEALTSPRNGRGKVREFIVQPWAESLLEGPSVRLLEVGELAKVGEIGFANLNAGVTAS